MKHTPLFVSVLALALLGAACGTPTRTSTQNTSQTTNTSPVTNTAAIEESLTLQNLGGATFAAHTTGAATAGSFSMSKTYLDTNAGRTVPVFLFGQPLPGRSTAQLNPNLEFGGMPTALTVVSAIDGIVGFVRQQEDSNDYEVFLQPSENSIWTIGYDHLTNVLVKQGDRVTAGQTLGKAARENNGMYRYELQINKDVNGVTTFHCPTALLADSVRATTVASIERFIKDWNTFYGSKAYGTYTTSCTKPTLTLSETQ